MISYILKKISKINIVRKACYNNVISIGIFIIIPITVIVQYGLVITRLFNRKLKSCYTHVAKKKKNLAISLVSNYLSLGQLYNLTLWLARVFLTRNM